MSRSGRAHRKTGGSAWTQLSFADMPADSIVGTPPSGGEWLEVLVADLAIELGDVENLPSHRGQVKELWRQSGLPEAEFAKALVEVRARAKGWRGRINRARPEAEPDLKMKAFFLLLRDRVGLVEGTGAALSSVNRFKRGGARSAGPSRPRTAGERGLSP
jgi:hypothetical protein